MSNDIHILWMVKLYAEASIVFVCVCSFILKSQIIGDIEQVNNT